MRSKPADSGSPEREGGPDAQQKGMVAGGSPVGILVSCKGEPEV